MTLSRVFEGPRAVNPAEIRSLLGLLNRSFDWHVYAGMRAEYPHVYSRMNRFCAHHRVILHKGRIAAHVGVYPLEFVTPRGRVTAGGIGAVCTEKKFQGKGLMTDLLGEAVRWMKEQDMPLSILWGNRYRYQRFGWEPAGCRYAASFGGRALPLLSRYDLPSAAVASPAGIIGDLHSLHRRLPYRIEVDRETFILMLKRAGRRVWAAREGGRIRAYAVVRRDKWEKRGKTNFGWNIDAWSGSLEGVLSIVRSMLDRPGADFVRCFWPGGHTRIPVAVLEAADSWSSGFEHMGQIRINDLKSTMTRLGAGNLLAPVRALGWDGRAQARLLFGPASPGNLLAPRQAAGVLGRELPLGLFIEPLDGI